MWSRQSINTALIWHIYVFLSACLYLQEDMEMAKYISRLFTARHKFYKQNKICAEWVSRPTEGRYKHLNPLLSAFVFSSGVHQPFEGYIKKMSHNKTDCVTSSQSFLCDSSSFFLCRPTHSPAPIRRRPTWTHRLSLVPSEAFSLFNVTGFCSAFFVAALFIFIIAFWPV